jgi:hypothetical protein
VCLLFCRRAEKQQIFLAVCGVWLARDCSRFSRLVGIDDGTFGFGPDGISHPPVPKQEGRYLLTYPCGDTVVPGTVGIGPAPR